jgi:hypothetical protein
MRWACDTGKHWKHEPWNAVISLKGGDPSMLSVSSTRRITGKSGCVMGWAFTLSSSAPPDGSTASTCGRQSHRV